MVSFAESPNQAEAQDMEDIKLKHRELEEVCAPVISKYYGGAGAPSEPDEDEAHDEL